MLGLHSVVVEVRASAQERTTEVTRNRGGRCSQSFLVPCPLRLQVLSRSVLSSQLLIAEFAARHGLADPTRPEAPSPPPAKALAAPQAAEPARPRHSSASNAVDF